MHTAHLAVCIGENSSEDKNELRTGQHRGIYGQEVSAGREGIEDGLRHIRGQRLQNDVNSFKPHNSEEIAILSII